MNAMGIPMGALTKAENKAVSTGYRWAESAARYLNREELLAWADNQGACAREAALICGKTGSEVAHLDLTRFTAAELKARQLAAKK